MQRGAGRHRRPRLHGREGRQSAAAKSTVGVGGRCSAAKRPRIGQEAVGIEDKGPLDKKKNKNDTPIDKAKDAVKN